MFVACVKCEENINFASPKHFSRCNENSSGFYVSEQLSLLLQYTTIHNSSLFSFLVLSGGRLSGHFCAK